MDVFVFIALAALALLLSELLLPTGGVLAALGATGLIAAGVVALGDDSEAADIAGAGLITLGVLAAITTYFVARKVLEAHRDRRVRTGPEELRGSLAEARGPIDPTGQVWLEGALWRARLVDGEAAVQSGDRVRVEAVEGLTLVVRSEPSPAQRSTPSTEGAS